MKKKRLVAMGDYHCGHYSGLTPPSWDGPRQEERYPNRYNARRIVWDWYAETLAFLKPIDILLVNGDLIDGSQEKSGGTELLVTDPLEQIDMAIDCIKQANAKSVVLTFGTQYHTGIITDFEKVAADRLPNCAKIGGEDTYNINGWQINARHHVGRSSIPHGRFTPVAREQLGNMMWAARGEYPLADIILRSHVHYFVYCGGADPQPWLAVTLPALQSYGGKFGTRRMTGTVDIGMVCFDLPNKEKDTYTWQPILKRLPLHQSVSL